MKAVKHTLEEHRAMDSEQLAQRIKLGDHLEQAREIEHFALFHKRADAAATVAELTDLGFRTSLTRQGFGTIRLEARTESDIEQDTVDAFVAEIYAIVDRHGGIYDGWGGPVMLRGNE